jgi:hypothetical protein
LGGETPPLQSSFTNFKQPISFSRRAFAPEV